MLKKFFLAIMMIAILSGCSHNTAAPTTASVQDLVNTQAAQTVAAVLTQNTPTSIPPTLTVVTATPVPPTNSPTTTISPTITPTLSPVFLTLVPSNTPVYNTRTPSSTPNGYSCEILSTKPKSTGSVKVNANFNFSWVIMNTGNSMWGQHNADLEYVSGKKMQTGGDSYDLTKDVYGGDTYTATVPMSAPSKAGTYTATWEIVQDSMLVCTLPLSLNVTN